ncbi:MAG TPA: hypothetical protein VHQ21_03035 [Rhodanobacteraceae bacterium]|nr:hypothetical protein [Rhodanobacteraceae bacterium]
MKICCTGIVAGLLLAACANPDSVGSTSAGGAAPRVIASIAVANAGFEEPGAPNRIPGWTLSQHAGVAAYEMTEDATAPFAGRASFRMRRTERQVFGLLFQEIPIDPYAGKTLELSAMARTADVGPLGWALYVDVPGGREMAAPLTGTTDWHAVRVRVKVPADAHQVSIGAMLLDAGTGWLDDVKLNVVEP